MRIDFVKKGVDGTKFQFRVLINGTDSGKIKIDVNRIYKNVCILYIDSSVLTKEILTQFSTLFKGLDMYIKLHPLEVKGEIARMMAEVPVDEVYKTVWNSSSSSAQKVYKLKK